MAQRRFPIALRPQQQIHRTAAEPACARTDKVAYLPTSARRKVASYLGKDAENITTKQQRTFTVLSLATKSGYKDKQTQHWVNHTEWHRIVAFGKPADYAKSLKKGDYVEIEGELRSTEYAAEVGEGKKKTTVKRRGWEIRASIVRKLAQPAWRTAVVRRHDLQRSTCICSLSFEAVLRL
jgi:single-strand DNA-binding protein